MRGNTLISVFSGTNMDYAPLSKSAKSRILQFDRAAGFGPGGEQPNRNRFYLYLTQRGSDVQIRTVAVKSAKRTEPPVLKEVALASVDDPYIHIKDIAHYMIAGYVVDWSPEGVCRSKTWDYRGRWETEAYALRCMWKINAPVVNPELLKRTRRFRWSDWASSQAHILDYLKVFNEHPEIEFLSKRGLGRYCTKVTIVRKLKADRNFRQFFSRHADVIRRERLEVNVIMKAYRHGVSFSDARREIAARRSFRYCSLPREVCAVKAAEYVDRFRLRRDDYAAYMNNCAALGLDLDDTKVAFPKQFKRRSKIVQDQYNVMRAEQDASRSAKLNGDIAAMADRWGWLEKKRGNYRIVIPRSTKDLVMEGRALSNCLGQKHYAAKIARGEALVVFVRDAACIDAAFIAVEYSPHRGIVTQCYGKNNSKPPQKAMDFVKRVFGGARASKIREAA